MSIFNLTKQPQDFRPIPARPLQPFRKGDVPRPQRRHAPDAKERWRPEYAHWVKHLALLGATDSEIARALGVSHATFVRWKEEKYILADALRSAALADAEVVASMHMRAVGFTHPVEKLFHEKVTDGDGNVRVNVKRVTVTEYVPPDVTAGYNWLERRQPERWRSRHELTGAGGAPLIPPQSGDVNLAISIVTSGTADQTEAARAYLRLVGAPAPAALPSPVKEEDKK